MSREVGIHGIDTQSTCAGIVTVRLRPKSLKASAAWRPRLVVVTAMPAPSTAVAPSKRVLVDKFAEMALFDAAENQRVIVEGQKREAASKVQMRKALDEQVRLKQETIIRERDADKEWVGKEQERIKIWNEEEKKKIAEQRAKEET
eukprot:6934562-Prymnesium_polylepis.1